MKDRSTHTPISDGRRHFIKAALGLGMGLPLMRASGVNTDMPPYRNTLFPLMGANGGLARANEVYQAGGDYVLESVGRFLKPSEPEAAFEAQLKLLEQSPLPVLSCNSFLRGDQLRCVGPNAQTDQVLRFAETAFRRAQRAGVKYIVFGSNKSRHKPDDWTKEQVDEQFVPLLQRMGTLAGEHDVVVAVENLQAKECNYLTRLREVGAIIQAVDHRNVRMLADLYHASCMQDPAEDLLNYGHLVDLVEIAEAQGRTAPGVHGQDFSHYFDALREVDFSGPIEIEGKWKAKQLARAFKTIYQQSA